MIEDLTKILAYGYVGLELEKRKKEVAASQAKNIEELKKYVIIVYDGKAPYVAAQNLAKYMEDEGYKTDVRNREQFRSLEGKPGLAYPRVIVVGHHDFAKEQMETVDLKFDHYGLKFGVKDRRYVLRASRSDLSFGKKGRKEFAAYYDREMASYQELAQKYGVPTTFGQRSETRESQYDLLWLICVLQLQSEMMSELCGKVKFKYSDEPGQN